MPTTPVPLAMPDDLLDEVREAAKATGLSQQDVMRQSMKAGLPKVREQFGKVNLSPLPESAIASGYRKLSEADIAADKQLGRASLKAQRK